MSGTSYRESYAAAAGKHLDDAHDLLSRARYDNAAYLSGYVAECSLKALLAAHGTAGKLFGHDISALRGPALQLAVLLAPGAARYRPPAGPGPDHLEAHWDPSMRYTACGQINSASAIAFVDGATSYYDALVVPLRLDGRRENP